MGFWQVCGVAPLPSRALVRLHEGQGPRELPGQKEYRDHMYALRLPGLKVVADPGDDRIDDFQPSLFLDLPNGSGLEGLVSPGSRYPLGIDQYGAWEPSRFPMRTWPAGFRRMTPMPMWGRGLEAEDINY